MVDALWDKLHYHPETREPGDYQITLMEYYPMDCYLKVLDESGKMLAVLIVGLLLRKMHHGEFGVRGFLIEYEFVDLQAKKINLDLGFGDNKTANGKILLQRLYGWGHVNKLVENRMEERMRWIETRAREVGWDIDYPVPLQNNEEEALRVSWRKEKQIYNTQWINKYCLYLSVLQSPKVQEFVCGREMALQLPRRVAPDGSVLEWGPFERNHGAGPKINEHPEFDMGGV